MLNKWIMTKGQERIYLITKVGNFYFGVYHLYDDVIFDVWPVKDFEYSDKNVKDPNIKLKDIHREIISKVWNIGFKLRKK